MKYSANIYELGKVNEEYLDAVRDGFERISEIVGQITVNKALKVSHPALDEGVVTLRGLGSNRLDRSVLLHVVVTDLHVESSKTRSIGIGDYGSGLGITGVRGQSGDLVSPVSVQAVAEHEIYHSAGFVRMRSETLDELPGGGFSGHCNDEDCLMHSSIDMKLRAAPEPCALCSEDAERYWESNVKMILESRYWFGGIDSNGYQFFEKYPVRLGMYGLMRASNAAARPLQNRMDSKISGHSRV